MNPVAELEAEPVAQDGGCARPDSLFGWWSIEPQRFERMFGMAKEADLEALRKEARKAKKEAVKVAAASEPEQLYSLTGDGLAVIEISGPMTKYETSFSSLFGGTSTLRTRRALRAAARNPEVLGIMVRFDSPGGSVAGTSDLADDMRAADARKPTYAFAEDLMASAALWAGTQGRKLFANKGAEIGSIGAYGRVYDTSGVYAQRSVKVHVISSAPPIKGAGVEGTEITPAQLAEFKREVKDLADIFVNALAEGRGMTMERAQQLHTGQVWTASKAKDLGLIDDVVSFDEAMRRLRSEAMTEKDAQAAMDLAKEAEDKAAREKTAREAADKENGELKARLQKLEGDARKKRFDEEAKAFGLAADFAGHLDAIEAAVKPEVYQALVTQLKAASEQSKTAALFSEKGTAAAAAGTTATEQIQALAAGLVKSGEAKDMAEGLKVAARKNPELYAAHVADQRKK
jgi:signal peptide peptidase SppA